MSQYGMYVICIQYETPSLLLTSGIVKLRFGEFKIGVKIEIDITLKANYLQVDNMSSSGAVLTSELRQMFKSFWKHHCENPLFGRDIILVSFCPQVIL